MYQKTRFIKDKVSNTGSDCTAFRQLLKKLNVGDTLFVVKLDHLGKNCDDVKNHWQIITKERGCDLVVLDTRLGETVKDVVIEAFDAFSGMKQNYAHRRQAEGIAVAIVNGAVFGRSAKPIPYGFPALADMYEKNLISARKAAERLNVAHNTFHKSERVSMRSVKT